MPRPAWQRRTTPPAKFVRAAQAGADMHTALAMLDRGAVATVDGAWTRLDVPGSGSTARLPTAIVRAAEAQRAEMDGMFGEGVV